MKKALVILLIINCFHLFSQNELVIWKRNLSYKYDTALRIDTVIQGKDTSNLKEIFTHYQNDFSYEIGKNYNENNNVLLIYFGDLIKATTLLKLSYNPLLTFIEKDKILNKYLGSCIPVYDDLPDGYWIAIKYLRDKGLVFSSIKTVKNGRLNGILKSFDSNGEVQNEKNYINGYITDETNFNSSDSIINTFDKCGILINCKTYQDGKLTFLQEDGLFPYEVYFDDHGQVISIEFENKDNKIYLEFDNNILSERIIEFDVARKKMRNEIFRRANNKYRKANGFLWNEDSKKGMTEIEYLNFILLSDYTNEVLSELKLIDIIISKKDLFLDK